MKRSKNNTLLIVGVLVITLVLGLLTFAIGNFAGRPVQTVPAQITDVSYRSGYDSRDSNHHVTHHSAEWRITVRTPAGDDTLSRSWSPPGWMHEGATVRASYQVGRWLKSVNVNKIEQVS